jgi:hypothetical protein
MTKLPAKLPRDYASLLRQVKDRIRQAQTRAVLSANPEMIWLYWDVGQLLLRRQAQKGWGAGVLERLAKESSQRPGRGQRVFPTKSVSNDAVLPAIPEPVRNCATGDCTIFFQSRTSTFATKP